MTTSFPTSPQAGPADVSTFPGEPHLHHAHVAITEGTSLRLTDATNGKGVMPLG